MVKILLIAGHGQGDPGAVGNGLQEATETRDVVNRLAPLLRAKGANITVFNQAVDAYASIQRGTIPFNASYDYVFEVHFNSVEDVSAHGTEIYVTTSESSVAVEQKVMEKLSKFFTNRSVKRNNFAVIQTARNLGMSSALLEVCFVSNASDAAKYKANKQAIAQAICDGISEGFGYSNSTTNSNNTTENKKEENQEESDMIALVHANGAIHYYNGETVTTLVDNKEVDVLRDVYKENYKKEIPVLKKDAAWLKRLKAISKR